MAPSMARDIPSIQTTSNTTTLSFRTLNVVQPLNNVFLLIFVLVTVILHHSYVEPLKEALSDKILPPTKAPTKAGRYRVVVYTAKGY